MTRESYSIACLSTGCRWARVYIRSRDEAEKMARAHGERGHQVQIDLVALDRSGRSADRTGRFMRSTSATTIHQQRAAKRD